MSGLPDTTGQFRKAFRDGAKLAIADERVLTCLGHPGKQQPDDIFAVGDTTADFDFATMGTNRSREIVITQEGAVSVFRKGGLLAEEAASDRGFELIWLVEEYFRGDGTDAGNARTTLGGLVRWCMCTKAGPAGGFEQQPVAGGRTVEIPFVFTARARIRS